MTVQRNAAKIIDLEAFRQQRTEQAPTPAVTIVPMLVWVPVWVFMPQHTS